MRTAFRVGVVAGVAVVAVFVKSGACAEVVSAGDVTLAGQVQWEALGPLRDYGVAVTPGVEAHTVDADLSNVEGGEALAYLTGEQKALLAGNGFLILPSASKEFYEIYYKNPPARAVGGVTVLAARWAGCQG